MRIRRQRATIARNAFGGGSITVAGNLTNADARYIGSNVDWLLAMMSDQPVTIRLPRRSPGRHRKEQGKP